MSKPSPRATSYRSSSPRVRTCSSECSPSRHRNKGRSGCRPLQGWHAPLHERQRAIRAVLPAVAALRIACVSVRLPRSRREFRSCRSIRPRVSRSWATSMGPSITCALKGIERFILSRVLLRRTDCIGTALQDGRFGRCRPLSPPIRDFEMGERVVTRMAGELSVGDFARRAASVRGLLGLLKADHRRTYSSLVLEKLRHRNGSSSEQTADRETRYGISPRFLEPLSLVRRKVPVLLIYGDADDFSDEFDRAASTSLREILSGLERRQDNPFRHCAWFRRLRGC